MTRGSPIVQPAPHFPRWAEVLGRGDVVSSHICDLPDDERAALALAGSLSVLAVPIFVAGDGGASSASKTPSTSATGASPRPRRSEQPPESSPPRSNVSRPRATCVAATPCSKPSATARNGSSRRRAGATRRPTSCRSSARRPARAGRICSRTASARMAGGSQASGSSGPTRSIAPQLANPVMQDMCFEEVGLERVAELGARNELFTGKVKDLPARRAGRSSRSRRSNR